MDPAPSPRPRVVIVGGGFGGLSAAKRLAGAAVDVTLIDRTNHYLFQPLLYQVAAGVLSPADIAVPIRFLLRKASNVTVLLGNVEHVDVGRRLVLAEGGRLRLEYDYLIAGTGARHAYFDHPEWESLAPGLKTLDDARQIRRRFLFAFEEAERSTDPAEQAALLTFVIVGGGPTGVELAGILPTIASKGLRGDFRRVDPARVRVVLLEGGPRLLPSFADDLSQRACRDLEELGVQCRTGARVTRVTPDAVYVGDERIATRTVFWAAGNAASPLIAGLGGPIDGSGRLLVGPDLTVPGRPNVFVIGDAAAVAMPPPRPGPRQVEAHTQYVPGLAAAANQMGDHAARMVLRSIRGEPLLPFTYRDKGSLAVIGRGKALADFGRFRFTGRIAFLLWLFVHLLYLAGFRNRVSVALEWAYAYFTYRPGARLLTEEDAKSNAPRPV
jgi:NADH:ubiquinone reductase (H+-translocating)